MCCWIAFSSFVRPSRRGGAGRAVGTRAETSSTSSASGSRGGGFGLEGVRLNGSGLVTFDDSVMVKVAPSLAACSACWCRYVRCLSLPNKGCRARLLESSLSTAPTSPSCAHSDAKYFHVSDIVRAHDLIENRKSTSEVIYKFPIVYLQPLLGQVVLNILLVEQKLKKWKHLLCRL